MKKALQPSLLKWSRYEIIFSKRVVEILVIFASVLTYFQKGQFYETSTYKTAPSVIIAVLLSKSGILENEGLDAIDRSIQTLVWPLRLKYSKDLKMIEQKNYFSFSFTV